MKIVTKNNSSPFLLLLFYAFLGAAILAPISADSFITALADYVNHVAAIIEANKALSEGQFPLRIAPDWTYRYPYYQFYSPTTYTIGALIYKCLTPSNPLTAYKITAWLTLIFGGFYMDRLIYWFIRSRSIALLSTVVYLMSPYFIAVINNFGDLSEIMALCLVPAALYYSLQRYLKPNDKNLLQIGLIGYLLITTHIVTFIYTSLFCGLLYLMVTIKNRHHWKNLIQVFIGFCFSCLLAMWYLAPVIWVGNELNISHTFSGSYTDHFMNTTPVLSQLLFPGASEFKSALIYNHPSIGWLMLIAVGTCCYAFFKKTIQLNPRAAYWLPFILILFFLGFFLTWSPFNFWRFLPHILMIGQYSWRLLDQVIWTGTFIFACMLCWLFKQQLDLKGTVLGLILIAAMTVPAFPTLETAKVNLSDFIKNPNLTYNKTSYLLNFNDNTHYVGQIDTLMLYSLMANNILQLKTPYILKRDLLNYAINPTISLKTDIPKDLITAETGTFAIALLINNTIVATHSVSAGKLSWDVPLAPILNKNPKKTDFTLQFQLLHTKQKIAVPINELVLTGFFKPNETLSPTQIQPHCKQIKSWTECKLHVAPDVKWLKLPVHYYPHMLTITLNGKSVPYQGIVYYDYLLAGIAPLPNQENVIRIQFHGLKWANQISLLSWCLWGLMLGLISLKYIKERLNKLR